MDNNQLTNNWDSIIGTFTKIIPEESSCEFLQMTLHKILEQYWNLRCKKEECLIPFRHPGDAFKQLQSRKIPSQLEQLIQDVSTFAATLSNEDASYYISTLYTKLLPKSKRKSLGAFYTPPPLVTRLLDSVSNAGFDWNDKKIIDPACGGGAFLGPVAEKILKEKSFSSPGKALIYIEKHLTGFEIDPVSAWMSLVFLDVILINLYKKTKRPIKNIIEVGDSLQKALKPKRKFDLVLGNPPYGKISLRSDMRNAYSRSIYGHANLYGLFMDAGLRLCKKQGHIAFITSTSYLGGSYFSELRHLLLKNAPPVVMDFISSRKGVFSDVLQETIITVFEKKHLTLEHKSTVNSVEITQTGLHIEHVGNFSIPRDNLKAPWLVPKAKQHVNILTKALTLTNSLTDLGYEISTGQLVWNRCKEQLQSQKTKKSFPLIWAEAIKPGGKFKFAYKNPENHYPYFRVNQSQDYLLNTSACIIAQRTTSKEQNRRIAATIIPDHFFVKYKAAVIENHINIIKPHVSHQAPSLEAILALLRSQAIDVLIRSINGSVAISAFELNCLPMPSKKDMSKIETMIRSKKKPSEIENYINHLYGVC